MATMPRRAGAARIRATARAVPPTLLSAGAIAVLALLARLVYGAGAIGYDASFALVWGREIAHGQMPEFRSAVAPTPHPLANLVSALLSPLGDHAPAVVLAISFVSIAALVWFGGKLGARLFNPAVGVLFGLLLFTRPALANETLQALVDIPFLALVAAAAAGVAGGARPRYVLVLLALAGLLRPEGWPLAILYAAWCWRKADGRERVELAVLAFAAPLIWFGFDAVVTGDPLYSLHGTQTLAADLARPRGTGSALVDTPSYLRSLIQPAVAWLGLIGCIAGLMLLYERALVPAAIAGVGLVGFIVLGFAGLPVLTRYLFVPACILTLFAAVATSGWLSLPAGPSRRWWSYASALAALALLLSIPSTHDAIHASDGFLAQRQGVYAELHTLVRSPAGRRAIGACGRVVVPEHRPVPLVAYWLGRKPSAIGQDPTKLGANSAYFAFANAAVAQTLSLDPTDPIPPTTRPAGFHTAARTANWRLFVNCR
jgi:hypothetical protein